ncbi:MAG TPA: lactonase family protein, partial [Acidimicrobiia bacterium]|nr:lactonase family protein [Acidimicrobiia bacterium]
SSGTLAVLPIRGGGALAEASNVVQHHGSGADPRRQGGPHAHCIVPDPGGRNVLSCDLGADQVFVYRLDAEAGRLVPAISPSAHLEPGSGPRHIAFHPHGRWAYVINELGNTMTAFTYDPDTGRLDEIGSVSTLPEGYAETSYCADVHVAPSGRYVYGSNRGHDSIVTLRVDEPTGMVEPVSWEPTQGSFPRNFFLSPDGTWLLAANQKGDNVVSYRVDVETGLLEPTGHTLRVSMPVCLLPLF